jgi:hypothetical protein
MVRIPAGEPKIWMEGYLPFETKDGRVVYAKNGKRGIFARSLKGEAATNPEEKLVDDYSSPIAPMQVFPDGLYYLSRPVAGFESPRLRFYSFVTRRSVDIAALRMGGGGFTISPDRRRIVYDAPIVDGVDLSVIEMRRAR